MGTYNFVRPVAEMALRFGQGKTFCQKYDIDLAATYDFSCFWGQNMMRSMLDEVTDGVASGNNDLQFRGLTVTAAFKF